MADKPLLSPELLRQLIRYEPETGHLFWLARDESFFQPTKTRTAKHIAANWNSRRAGTRAFTSLDKHGYNQTNFNSKTQRAHRVAWAIYYGEWPKNDIDHINRIRSDNRICNLRDVTRTQNLRNKSVSRRNKSGFTGIHKSEHAWIARICNTHIGSYRTEEEAIAARRAAELLYGYLE